MDFQDSIEALDADLIKLHKALFQHKSWQELQRLAGVDIDRASIALLKAVAYGDGQCKRPQDIAHYLAVEAPTITRKAQQLEADGLLTRSPDPKDGRAQNFTITRQGQALLKKIQKARRDQLAEALRGWDQHELLTFIRLLQCFNEDLGPIITHTKKEN